MFIRTQLLAKTKTALLWIVMTFTFVSWTNITSKSTCFNEKNVGNQPEQIQEHALLRQRRHIMESPLKQELPTVKRENATMSITQNPQGSWHEPSEDAVSVNQDGRLVHVEKKYQLEMYSDSPSTVHSYVWGLPNQQCDKKKYNSSEFPSVSVIISFVDNEKLSHLLHTVHSVVQRTPRDLLEEIILVDDASHQGEFKEILDHYAAGVLQHVRIRILRSVKSLGLIRARLWGIREAIAEVVVCMDSHMEVQNRWLEPLLAAIQEDPHTLASSYLDWMTQSEGGGNWSYKHGASSWKTVFDWSLTFGFQDISSKDYASRAYDPTAPVRTPMTVGGMFAIRKDWFQKVGEFDEEMLKWGCENIDLPIRVWLFGGRVVNVPCSHAAHLEAPGHRMYRTGYSYQVAVHTNYLRFVEVWLDEYLPYFEMYSPVSRQMNLTIGNLEHRRRLKEESPHNFSWFLDNVFPELGIPDKQTFAFGWLKNLGHPQPSRRVCIGTQLPLLRNPDISDCFASANVYGFFWNSKGELRFPIHVFNAGKDTSSDVMKLTTKEYLSAFNTDTSTKWLHYRKGPLVAYPSNQCLEYVPGSRDARLQILPCNSTNHYQNWEFDAYTQDYVDIVSGKYVPKTPSHMHEAHLKSAFSQYTDALRNFVKVDSFRTKADDVFSWWDRLQSWLEERQSLTGAKPPRRKLARIHR